jgi:hypothetical protein
MDQTGHTNLLARPILALSPFAVILSGCSNTPAPAATQIPDLVQASRPDGRFTFPQPADGARTSFCLDNGGQAVFGSNYDNPIQVGVTVLVGWRVRARRRRKASQVAN